MSEAEQIIDKQPEQPKTVQRSSPADKLPKEEIKVKKNPKAKKDMGKKPSEPIKGLNAVAVRNNYYRDGYRILKLATVIQGLIALVMGLVILYLINTQDVKYVYFATTEDGRLVKMSALSEPNLSAPALMSWSAQAVSQTMTFGFHDYKKRLQESSRFFTRAGWGKFTEALEKSGIMDGVESNQQVVTAAPKRAPIIVREGMSNGRYEWYVEIPMSITYKAGAKVRAESPLVRLKIVRVPKLENPHGVGIEQWIQ